MAKQSKKSGTKKAKKFRVLFLHGPVFDVESGQDAIKQFIEYDGSKVFTGPTTYRIIGDYGNGNKVTCEFDEKLDAIYFLSKLPRASPKAGRR